MDPERERDWKPRILKCHVCATRSAAMTKLSKEGDPSGAYVVVEEE